MISYIGITFYALYFEVFIVFMKKILLIFLLLFTSCSTIKYVPVKETEYVTVTETVVDTVIKWMPPVEKIVNETKDTTSTVETSLAKSTATVSNGTLHHSIENKKDSVKTKIVYKDKIVTKIEYKDVPVPVEVEKKVIPKWVSYSLGLNILILSFFLGRLILKLYFHK